MKPKPPGLETQRPDSIEDLYRLMLEQESDSMDFGVTRDRREPGRTFSKQAIESLHESMQAFVLSRIARRMREAGPDKPGPGDLKVSIKVTLDGESIEVPDDLFPWYVIDGSHRGLPN